MIEVEEKMKNGFSVFNRGNNLKKSLINPEKIKQFLKGESGITNSSTMGPPKLPGALKLDFIDDKNLNDEVQWELMMAYFKGNPAALLDALPSPMLCAISKLDSLHKKVPAQSSALLTRLMGLTDLLEYTQEVSNKKK